jgi:hypothetical protein
VGTVEVTWFDSRSILTRYSPRASATQSAPSVTATRKIDGACESGCGNGTRATTAAVWYGGVGTAVDVADGETSAEIVAVGDELAVHAVRSRIAATDADVDPLNPTLHPIAPSVWARAAHPHKA